jgi:hypothetical protein
MRATCEVVLPLPSEFDLEPVWSHPRASWLVQHRVFTPLCLLFLVVSEVLANLSSSLTARWIMFAVSLLASGIGAAAALTQTDRRMLRSLARSFEYWLLIGNLLLMILCRGVELNWNLVQMLNWAITFGCGVYVFSLDAMLHMSRTAKGIVIGCAMLINIAAFVGDHLLTSDTVSVTIFLYQSDTRSLRGSALSAILFFLCKYLLAILFRPRRLLIVSSPIVYDLKQRNKPEDTVTPASELHSLQSYQTRLLD